MNTKTYDNIEICGKQFSVGDYIETVDKYVDGKHSGKINLIFSKISPKDNKEEFYIKLDTIEFMSIKVKHIISAK